LVCCIKALKISKLTFACSQLFFLWLLGLPVPVPVDIFYPAGLLYRDKDV